MCDAWESNEANERCNLIRQLGALYDKGAKTGADHEAISHERRHVSARLLRISTWRGSMRHPNMPTFCTSRGS